MKIDTIKISYEQNILKLMDIIHEGETQAYILSLKRANKRLDEINPFSCVAPMREVMMIYLQKKINLLTIKYLKDENLESFKNDLEKLNDAANELIKQGLL